jgi:hypothetical protein
MNKKLYIDNKNGVTSRWYQNFIEDVDTLAESKDYNQKEIYISWLTVKEELLETYNATLSIYGDGRYLEFHSEEYVTLFLLKYSWKLPPPFLGKMAELLTGGPISKNPSQNKVPHMKNILKLEMTIWHRIMQYIQIMTWFLNQKNI